ncbi:Transmembrane protein-like protein [Aphelenchoides besseyi]|nr:Transmembrane protein-like protein [Aphelenchoides besseyi]KAI6211129.1 Transmembrane protein-like protein [Aphelenchoides besseyi]
MAPPRAQLAAVTIEQTAQKPKRYNLCRSLRRNFHWKCFASTGLIQICVLYVVWCQIKYAFFDLAKDPSHIHGPCANAYKFVPLGFAFLLYLIYLCECWHQRGKLEGIPILTIGQFLDHVDRMRNSTPVVWWKSVCYHYKLKHQHVTRYRNGDAVTATQVYYERVNSHTSGNVFMFDVCGVKDISKDIIDADDFSLFRVRFTKGFVFACVQAANDFEDQRTRFFNENEIRDDYMEVREGLDFAECRFVEQALVCANDDKRLPFYMRSTFYWIACALLFGWPLRLFIDWRLGYLHYQVNKLFGSNYLSPSDINYTGPITRSSTIDTAELELANRQNYLVVPSYSEAILLDPLHPNLRSEIRFRNEPFSACNETTIVPNYGAIGAEDEPDEFGGLIPASVLRLHSLRNSTNSPLNRVSRSRSMSFSLNTAAVPLPRPSQLNGVSTSNTRGNGLIGNYGTTTVPSRSISIAGAIYEQSNNSSVTPVEIDDRRPLMMESFRGLPPINHPPPTYEVAIRMCAPIYNRLRQSANSISSLLSSISRSNSKDLRQYSLDGPGSSKDGI